MELSVAEFCLLASVLGAGQLIGLQDPWPNMERDAIEAELARARDQLAAQGLIEVRADRRIVVDGQLAGIVGTCSFPEAVCVLTHSLPTFGHARRYFHLTRHRAVEMGRNPPTPDRVTLIAYPSSAEVCQRIAATFRLKAQPVAPVPAGSVPRRLLGALQGNDAEVGSELQRAGVSPELSAALMETFAQPLQNGSLVVMAPRGQEWAVDGVALLEGANALWRISASHRDGEEWVDLEPVSAEALRLSIEQMISNALPRPGVAV